MTYHRVVLVDDEDVFRRVIAKSLMARGIDIRQAATAEQAIQTVLEVHPDLLLLDINLPDQTGWDVLRDLRQRGVIVPTIVLSAIRINPNRLREFQPLAYLPKPFPLDALLRLVVGPRPGPADRDGVPGAPTGSAKVRSIRAGPSRESQ